MAFITRLGIYFGFLLGLAQTIIWALTQQPLTLPIFGFAIGLFTDWLAIKMVFFPRDPIPLLGNLRLQGAFQRRREEVAQQYADLIAAEVMTVPNIVDALLRGPHAHQLHMLIQDSVGKAVAEQISIVRPLVTATVGEQRLQDMTRAAATQAMDRLYETVRPAEDYLNETFDVRNTVITRMRELSRVEYEQLLRPAFRQDEWKLIAVGAILGFCIGELQMLLLLA